jgi:hypothetical protein
MSPPPPPSPLLSSSLPSAPLHRPLHSILLPSSLATAPHAFLFATPLHSTLHRAHNNLAADTLQHARMPTTIAPQNGQLMRSSVRTTDRTKANLFYIPYFPKFDVNGVLKHCTTNASLIEEAKTVMKYRTAVVRKWLWSQPQCVSPPPSVNSDSVSLCSILFHTVILSSLTVNVSPPPFENNNVIVNIALSLLRPLAFPVRL